MYVYRILNSLSFLTSDLHMAASRDQNGARYMMTGSRFMQHTR